MRQVPYPRFWVCLVWILGTPESALAAACVSNATGNWSTAATWAAPCNVAGGPVAADTVTIRAAHNVTVDGTRTCASVALNSPTPNNQVTILNVGAGTLNVTGSVTVNGGAGNRDSELQIGAGTITIGGDLTIGGTASNARVNFAGNGTLNVAGNFGSGAVFTAGTGTVNYNGAAAQQIGTYTYNILKVNNAAGATLTGATATTTLTIGDLTANSVFDDGGLQLTSTGTLNLTSGTFKLGSATAATTFPAFATRNIAAGTTVEYASGVAQTVSITPAYQNLTFSGAGTKTTAAGTLSVAGDWSAGSATALNTNNTVVSLSGNLAGGGAITQGTGLITLGGDWTNTGAFTASAAGVTLTGSGKQIATGAVNITFTTLTVNGTYTNNTTGTVTVSTALSGSGTLTQGSNALLAINGTSGITNLDAATNSPNLVTYSGGVAQTVKATTYHNLTINNASNVSLGGDTTVNGTLNFTSGNLITGANTVTIAATGLAVTGAATSRHVVGNMAKAFPGTGSFTYTVGDGTNYTPLAVTFFTLPTTGDLTVSLTSTDHPQTNGPATSTSLVRSTQSVNRYWTLKKDAALVGVFSASATYVAGDIDVLATFSNFNVSRGAPCVTTPPRTCTSWAIQSLGAPAPSATQITATALSMTSGAAESDLAVGEPTLPRVTREKEFIFTRELY